MEQIEKDIRSMKYAYKAGEYILEIDNVEDWTKVIGLYRKSLSIEEFIERSKELATVYHIVKDNNEPCYLKQVETYTPVCPLGHTDCISDPAYIRYRNPEWYNILYGNLPPELAVIDSCPASEYDRCYDDEDK